jgi:ergothioneine biosynthesis protein EgtB
MSAAARFLAVRRRTRALAAPLSAEDCAAQSMPDASPVKWHLAHTTWFFETFVLARFEPRFAPFDPAFRYLFNSYYNGIGDRHPRAQRGLLTRPALDQTLAYRADVDARIARLLEAQPRDPALAQLIELGLQHEQQHQELILTDVKHLLAQNPTCPQYSPEAPQPGTHAHPLDWIAFEGGVTRLGFAGDGFCFDNELPRHRVFIEPFALASRLVTNGEYRAFVDAGGYRDAALWLSEGWDAVRTHGWAHPPYWQGADDESWREFTLRGLERLDPDRPVMHLSLYEADAFARWAGARLPTEAEWEHAASVAGPILEQLYGHCWQWTSSAYAPYPGYAAAPGAVGEYNGKFMVNQYVLRGASFATPSGHGRASYRNFFPAHARWQFTGLRLARQARPGA